jgi:hypothetical protein
MMEELKLQDPPKEKADALRIFISHKGKDSKAAERIKRIFKKCGSTNIKIFISERISPGVPWAGEIYDKLKRADWLLLLYTDPTEEWDWCLFEAGFFAGSNKGEQKRLICLHTLDDQPPVPVKDWQTVPVTDEMRMEVFLQDLMEIINPDLVKSHEDMQEVAKDIAEAFELEMKRRISSKWYTKYLTLSMNAAQVKELEQTGRVPNDVLCGLKENESLYVFGYGSGDCTMDKLEEGLEQHYKESWLMALGESLRSASLNKTPIPRIPILYSPSLKRNYHVILHCLRRFSDGSLEFYLLFIEKIPENMKEQGQELQKLGNMLKLGRAFRWQILTKFLREISVLMQRKDVEKEIGHCLENLKFSMDWVIGESQRLDILTGEDVVKAFEKEEDIQAIDNAVKNFWPEVFENTYAGIEENDLSKVHQALERMLEANKDYMIRAARRYAELMEKLL